MSSDVGFQPPQRVTDPHGFPASRDDWHVYRRWLTRYGRDLGEQLRSAPTLSEREAARRELDVVSDLTIRSEDAYEQFQIAQEDAQYIVDVRDAANRIHAQWVARDSVRPARDPRREVLTSIVYEDGEEGFEAGRPVGLDDEGRRLSASMYQLDQIRSEHDRVIRLPTVNVLALTQVLEEFAARLMLARQNGELTEGDAYIQAVIELQVDLASRHLASE